MNAYDHRKWLEKRREQVYGADRNVIDALLYLMRFQEAQEDDVARQIALNSMNEEGN